MSKVCEQYFRLDLSYLYEKTYNDIQNCWTLEKIEPLYNEVKNNPKLQTNNKLKHSLIKRRLLIKLNETSLNNLDLFKTYTQKDIGDHLPKPSPLICKLGSFYFHKPSTRLLPIFSKNLIKPTIIKKTSTLDFTITITENKALTKRVWEKTLNGFDALNYSPKIGSNNEKVFVDFLQKINLTPIDSLPSLDLTQLDLPNSHKEYLLCKNIERQFNYLAAELIAAANATIEEKQLEFDAGCQNNNNIRN
ncbi:MAG: hypothetical protein WDZ28_04210 [Simkaniaceae bacterium]